MGYQQPMMMPGFSPHYPPPPYSMPQPHQPSHAVAIQTAHQASAPAAEVPLPPSPAAPCLAPASPAPGSASFRQLEARVDTLFYCKLSNGRGWGEQGRPRGISAVNKLYECNFFYFFPQRALLAIIRNPNKINTHSFSCSTFNQSAFFKAGILVLQLNLLCCLCFARTPMQ